MTITGALLLLSVLAGPTAFAAPLAWAPLGEPGSGGAITAIAVSPQDPRRILLGGDLLGVGLSLDGGESWLGATGFIGHEIGDFTFNAKNPTEVWAGTMTGPHVSLDGGRTWGARRDGFPPLSDAGYSAPVQKILFDPATPKRLLAFGGSHRRWYSPGQPEWGAVWESRDAGRTWKKLALVAGGTNVLCAAVAPGATKPVFWAAADGRGAFRSTDGGRTWTARNQGLPHLNVEWIAPHPRAAGVLWAALGAAPSPSGSAWLAGGIWKTSDGGQSWKPAHKGLSRFSDADPNQTSAYRCVVVCPAEPGVLYTSDTSWRGAAVYRSGDGGASWKAIMNYDYKKFARTAYSPGPAAAILAASPRSSKIVFAGGTEYLLKGEGGKWTDLTAAPVAGNAETWEGLGFSGLCAANFRFNPARDAHSVIVAMDDGKFWQSMDFLKTWRWGGEGMPHWGGGRDVAFSGPGGFIMFLTMGQSGTFDGIAKTSDGGKSWTVFEGDEHGLPAQGAKAAAGGIYAMPEDPEMVWAAVGGKLYMSDTGGNRWTVAHEAPGLSWIAASPSSPTTFWVVGDEGLWKTEDGRDFRLIKNCPKGITRVTVDPARPDVLYAACWRADETGGLWRCERRSWKRLRDDKYIADVAVSSADPRRIAVITNDHPYRDVCGATGVWVTEDGGATWRQENTGLPVPRGEVIRFNPAKPAQLVIGTLGRGYFLTNWP